MNRAYAYSAHPYHVPELNHWLPNELQLQADWTFAKT